MKKTADKTDATLEQLEEKFGSGMVYRFVGGKFEKRPCFPTSSVALNSMLRIGGLPRGMITEIYGKEGGGKSSLCMDVIANAQRQGVGAAFIDLENGFDPSYASRLGVDLSKLLFSQPDHAEQTFQIIDMMIEGDAAGIIVVDSVAMLTPKAEFEGEIGDQRVAPQSRIISQALRKLTPMVRKKKVALIFINQLRDVIGAVGAQEKTQTPGGRALKHIASLRLSISRIAQIKDGDRVIGGRTRAEVKKSRICSPLQSTEFDLIYGQGISKETDLIDMGLETGVLVKDKNTLMFGDHPLGVGREKSRLFLVQNPTAFDKIYPLVVEKARQAQENLHRPKSE